MNATHKFYEYYTKHAWGNSKTEIIELTEDPDEYFQRVCEDFSWSEKFRGVEWKELDSPPKEWVLKKIKTIELIIDSNQKRLEDYIEIASKLKE